MYVISVSIFENIMSNVVSSVYSYYFIGIYDVDFLSFVFMDRYCKFIVNNVI